MAMASKTSLWWQLIVLIGLLACAPVMAQHPGGGVHAGAMGGGAHQHLDARYGHNRYYYDRGYSLARPPAGGIGQIHGPQGGRYWFHNGNWYRWYGGAWVVWGPPIGLWVSVLPPYYTTLWWYGIPYYYANDTYYVWDADRQAYGVAEPPDGIESAQTERTPASSPLVLYPQKGQSAEQQANDRYECHRWATQQTGFDPTVLGGNVPPEAVATKRDDYLRAQRSCLEGRGYTVK